ncbi:MAG TPA: uroporphyrinogen decarboxylase family protein, partial [Dehalococcoidia bacterium]|nr:uroporphyrinogen decarboxylase family protein [Dehalococcoidia bacterium]
GHVKLVSLYRLSFFTVRAVMEKAGMNGYERIRAVLERREPDMVPMMEWSIAPNVREALFPGCNDEPEFAELMGLDGVTAKMPAQLGGASNLPDRFTNQWGVVMQRTTEDYAPVDGPIKFAADLDVYSPPDPENEENYEGLRDVVSRFKGEKFIFWHSRAEFMTACELRGMADFLMDLMADPELAHRVLRVVNEYCCRIAVQAIERGADGVMLGDDWAYNEGPFMSPAKFEEFILPYFRNMVQTVKAAGGYVVKHCDGYVWPLMDMVVDSGIDGMNPIEPAAGMDIAAMKERYGDRISLLGNIDCGKTLSEAPVSQVVAEVKDAIRQAGPGGGYMLMSSNSIHTSVRPENYRAMVEATRKFGRYPLDMAALA